MRTISSSAVNRRAKSARRLRDILRAEILRNEHPHGTMPSEAELAVRHDASRNTVREALALLRREGLVDRVQGVGTFVVRHKTSHEFDQVHSWRGGGVHHEVLAMEPVPAGALIAATLGAEEGDSVLLLERRTMFEAAPLALWTTYLPEDVGQRLQMPGVDLSGDYYDMLESALGGELAGVQSTTEAVLSDGDVAELLGVPESWPLLLVERTIIDVSGRVVEYGFGRLRGDRVSFKSWRGRRETGTYPAFRAASG